jgi:hypothetical protein
VRGLGLSRWNHADAALVAVAMVGAALLIRGQIDAPPTAPVPVQAHPLIGSADTLAPGRVCVELWWDESTPDPSDDGWVYAWGEPSDLASWVTAGISRPCGDGVPGVGEVHS